jgi:hypothetical protein
MFVWLLARLLKLASGSEATQLGPADPVPDAMMARLLGVLAPSCGWASMPSARIQSSPALHDALADNPLHGDGGGVMSLSAREQRALDSIREEFAGSDPRLVSLLATFTWLASDEAMPLREKVQASSRRATHCSRRSWRRSRQNAAYRSPRRACQGMGFHRVVLLLWLLIAVTFVAIAVAISHGQSETTCTTPWSAVCTQPAPPHNTGFTARVTSPTEGV